MPHSINTNMSKLLHINFIIPFLIKNAHTTLIYSMNWIFMFVNLLIVTKLVWKERKTQRIILGNATMHSFYVNNLKR